MKLQTLTAVVLLLTASAHAQAGKPESKLSPAKAGKILSAQDKPQESQRQLIEFYERELAESEKKSNWEAIARRLALDFLEISADGKAYNKQQVAAYFPDVKVHSYKLSEMEFRSLAANAALLAYRSDVDASFKGKRLAGSFRVSSVWVRHDGAWLLKFHQVTPVPKQ